MARYIVVRPGVGEDGAAQAESSVDMGEWIQPADVEIPGQTGEGLISPDAVIKGSEHNTDLLTDEEMEGDALVAYYNAWRASCQGVLGNSGDSSEQTVGYESSITANVPLTLEPTPEDPTDPFFFQHVNSSRWSPEGNAVYGEMRDFLWRDAWRVIDWPDGAVGYEVEQQPAYDMEMAIATPERLRVSGKVIEYTTGVVSGPVQYFTLNKWFGPDATRWRVQSSPGYDAYDNAPYARFETSVGGEDQRRLDVELDASIETMPEVFSPGDFVGRAALWLSVGMPDVPGSSVELSLSVDHAWDTGGVGRAATVMRLEDPTWTVVYTARVPRFRWIYGTADVTPPILRAFPREDDRGAGAGRAWPTPRSEQDSNQTFGGYW